MAKTRQTVRVGGRELELTSLEKPLWPESDITKADYIHYIFTVSHLLLPQLIHRPLTVTRYPDGIEDPGFYQKDCPDYAPSWVGDSTFPVVSDEKEKITRYIVPKEPATLVWLANQAAIEFHPWMSTVHDPAHPTYVVIDLDPSSGSSFEDVKKVAAMVKEVLNHFNLMGFPKLSGATGIHIYVPIEPKYPYQVASRFAGYVGELIVRAAPQIATNERLVKNRDGKVYIDHLQNLPGKTIVAAYSARPRSGAPISVPFEWEELNDIDPSQFTLPNLAGILDRSTQFLQLFQTPQSLDHVVPLFS